MSATTSSQAKLQEPQPSISTVAPIPNGNPFEAYIIIKEIGRLASRADLAKLTGINNNYYATLKPDYIDAAGKKIIIMKPWNYPYRQHLVYDGKNKIHEHDWKSGFGQLFREVEIHSLLFLGQEPAGGEHTAQLVHAQSVIKDVCPYITIVRLNQIGSIQETLPLINVPQTGVRIAEFLNKFVNLKQLELTIYKYSSEFSQTELEDLLMRITEHSRARITLTIVHLAFWFLPLGPKIQLDSILALSTNIKLQLDFECFCSDILSDYHRYGARIEGISLELHLAEFTDDLTAFSYLNQLRPILNHLKTERGHHFLGNGNAWPNLCSLSIDSYNGPLVILKHCPQLKYLELLHIDQTRCIFYNPDQTAEEGIQEYFGKLQHLKNLKLRLQAGEFEIKLGNKLYDFLKTVLPKGVKMDVM